MGQGDKPTNHVFVGELSQPFPVLVRQPSAHPSKFPRPQPQLVDLIFRCFDPSTRNEQRQTRDIRDLLIRLAVVAIEEKVQAEPKSIGVH